MDTCSNRKDESQDKGKFLKIFLQREKIKHTT